MCKNTFTRAKDSRWEIKAPRWSGEIRKDALKRVWKIISYYPHQPTSNPRQLRMQRDTHPKEEEEWSERPTSPQTPAPGLPSKIKHQARPHRSRIQKCPHGLRLQAHPSAMPNPKKPGSRLTPWIRFKPQTEAPNTRPAQVDPSIRCTPVNSGFKSTPRHQSSLPENSSSKPIHRLHQMAFTGFHCRSPSVKTGRGAYFFKWTTTKTRPQKYECSGKHDTNKGTK